jgi:hypothetical protein
MNDSRLFRCVYKAVEDYIKDTTLGLEFYG